MKLKKTPPRPNKRNNIATHFWIQIETALAKIRSLNTPEEKPFNFIQVLSQKQITETPAPIYESQVSEVTPANSAANTKTADSPVRSSEQYVCLCGGPKGYIF